METELKLRFEQPEEKERFLSSTWFHQLVMPDSCVETEMASRYFDTIDQTLTSSKSSLRIRREGDVHVATVKLGGRSFNGLHQRLEWSVELDGEDWAEDPESGLEAAWFMKNAVSEGDPDERLREILEKIDGKPLIEICQAKFVRTAYDVGFGDTLMELALDEGELSAGKLSAPILELELELKEGSVVDLMDLGEELKSRFCLTPEALSKYSRCLALLQQQKDLQDV